VSFTRRIKLFLVAIALLPPLLMMTVVYFYAQRQGDLEYRHSAGEELRKLRQFDSRFRDDLARTLTTAAEGSWMSRAGHLAARGRSREIDFGDLRGFGLDYAELLDTTGRVIASAHRPSLVGETLSLTSDGGSELTASVEYDIDGAHAALGGVAGSGESVLLRAGRYLESRFQPFADLIVDGQTTITLNEADNAEPTPLSHMDPCVLYDHEGTLRALIGGGAASGYYLTAEFQPPLGMSVFKQFIPVISIVALGSILVAILLGIYIAGRAQREVDNLVEAFGKVAAGDMNAAVMAYHDEEFVKLADSFSEMMHRLRESQQKLATSEKIAAWQAMARKIAHEIKNPLTPIGISADDLRRSYVEKLPGFDQTLDQSTRMIRAEVDRLGRLLGEFVKFARMKPPERREADLRPLLRAIVDLYAGTTDADRVRITSHAERTRFLIDPDQITQLLLNLIKNGLEASPTGIVELAIDVDDGALRMSVRDNGPGFSPDVLARRFEPYLSTKPHGSGLGLVICRRIVYDHGGTITLGNREEGGAEVTVVLPQD